jgi:hypothetical protein
MGFGVVTVIEGESGMSFDDRAEQILRVEGFTFSLASKNNNVADLTQARYLLKQAIIRAFREIDAQAAQKAMDRQATPENLGVRNA